MRHGTYRYRNSSDSQLCHQTEPVKSLGFEVDNSQVSNEPHLCTHLNAQYFKFTHAKDLSMSSAAAVVCMTLVVVVVVVMVEVVVVVVVVYGYIP